MGAQVTKQKMHIVYAGPKTMCVEIERRLGTDKILDMINHQGHLCCSDSVNSDTEGWVS